MMPWLSRFVAELKRRRVHRVAAIYAVVGVGTAEGGQIFLEALGLPDSASRALALVILAGFPVALLLAWTLQISSEGLRWTPTPEASEGPARHRGGNRSALLAWGVAALALAFAIFRLGSGGEGATDTAAVALAAVADVEAQMDRGAFMDAYRSTLALPAAVPDSTRDVLLERASVAHAFTSDPPGASVSWRPYADPDADWQDLGRTPLEWRAPMDAVVLRVQAEGYVEQDILIWGGLFPRGSITLRNAGDVEPEALPLTVPQDMLEFVMTVGDARLAHVPIPTIGSFLFDRYEVTNEEYAEFVAAGGYERSQYWEEPFVRNGTQIAREDAITEFVDRTGRPGPAAWVGGTYPEGTADHPVTGLSWYEAMAYARFRGRALPTLYHWYVTAFPFAAEWIVPQSNIEGDGPAPVGSFPGVSWFGAYDMAGNAREWLVNRTGDLRYTVGGGWNDRPDLFALTEPQSPFDRSDTNGLRLMTHLGDPANFTAASAEQNYVTRDLRSEAPVSDEVFEAYREIFSYDDLPLNARIENVDTLNFAIRERITFDAAYGGERMVLYLFRPLEGAGPYQTILYMPGSGALSNSGIPNGLGAASVIVRSGRAVAFPVYKSTFERQDDYVYRLQDESNDHRDHVVMWYQDLGRSLDYLQTRPDVVNDRFGYLGVSWGGRFGSVMLALEDRFRAGVLVTAGFAMTATQPSVEPLNFAPRVRVPVIMLNGEYDQIFPLEESARVMYDLLGTREPDKELFVAEGGHFIPTIDITRETLNWFDRYLGPAR